MAEPDYLVVGRIVRAHGLLGEVQVEVLTDHPGARFAPGSVLLVGLGDGRSPAPTATEVVSVRPHGERLIVRFAGTESRDDADRLRGQGLWIPAEQAEPLDDGSYYAHQLVGLHVETMDGQALGTVRSLMETGATDVLVVRDDAGGKDVLLPMSAEVLVEIDLDAGRLKVAPLPGLLD